MTNQERADLTAELAKLRAKANARRDQPGFADNCRRIDQRIAEIEAQLAGNQTG